MACLKFASTNAFAMNLMNIIDAVLPQLVGEPFARDCRHLGSFDGESTYELGFVHSGRTQRAGVRMGLFVHLEDDKLRTTVSRKYPGMTYDHEDVAHYLRYRALEILPFLEAYNRRSTDYDRIAERLFSQAEDIRGRRFGI